jgi:hypothetical protein
MQWQEQTKKKILQTNFSLQLQKRIFKKDPFFISTILTVKSEYISSQQ